MDGRIQIQIREAQVPGTLAGLVLPAAGLPEVGHRGQLSIDGPPSKPEKTWLS
jgi:hypothetical protein